MTIRFSRKTYVLSTVRREDVAEVVDADDSYRGGDRIIESTESLDRDGVLRVKEGIGFNVHLVVCLNDQR